MHTHVLDVFLGRVHICFAIPLLESFCLSVPVFPVIGMCILYCVHVYLTWEDVNISVLYHVVLESGITNTLWSLSDTL